MARRQTLQVGAAVLTVLVLTQPSASSGQSSPAGSSSAATLGSPLERYTPVSQGQLLDPPDGEWLMWRRTYNAWGYSPLDQIDRENVGNLRLAWAWTMERGLQETTPLVHDGIMFLPQACDFIEALDARDGTLLWDYRRERVEHSATLACANRNATLYGDRLYIATHDAHLVALDARTGEVVWDHKVGDWEIGHHYSGGPQIIKGMVVAGMSGCYYINTRCWISAHDPDTGEEIWRTYTLAYHDEPNGDTWGDVSDEWRRGGSVWIAPSYDPELDLIFTGTAVPVPWAAIQRGNAGEDAVLYTNSTLALDPDTGEIVWYFQHLPGDEWDQDHPFERIVVDTDVAPDPDEVDWIAPDLVPGEHRKVITGVPGKPGIVWTLDAATGDFLWAKQTMYQNVIIGVDAEHRHGIANPAIKNAQIDKTILVCPSTAGGINWQAVAYSPETNAIYAPTNNMCMEYTPLPVEPVLGGYHSSADQRRVAMPGFEDQVGQMTAVDVATGETLWRIEQHAGFGGSVLTTGGGLVFASDDARRFRAFDAETGDVLWEQLLNAGAGGYPVSYEVDGVQYVAIAAGGGVNYRRLTPDIRQRSGGNMLFVFRLP
ncbi:MAG: PQQ-binding-like beta-propeller repeat protein [Gemmatimonadota bacterium]